MDKSICQIYKQNLHATSQALCCHYLETVAIPYYFSQALSTY